MSTHINRRTFLKEALCTSGALMLATQAAGMVKTANAEEAGDLAEHIDVTTTLDCDVVILGSGLAGLAAAVDGAQKGLDVILLEKNPYLGGTSLMTEGVFGCCSRLQKSLGILDDAEHYFRAAMEYHHWSSNARLTRRCMEAAGACVDWLEDNGVEYRELDTTLFTVPTWHVYKERGCHIPALATAAEAAGVRIFESTPGKQLLTNDNGDAVGVIAVNDANEGIQINAKAVILATGGYACNRDMMETYSSFGMLPREDESDERNIHTWYGAPGRDGDGILMGMGAGGDTHHLGAIMPNYAEVYGPAVAEEDPIRNMMSAVPTLQFNESGVRFTDESLFTRDFVAVGECAANQGKLYSMMDYAFLKRQEEGVIIGTCGAIAPGTPFPGGIDVVEQAVQTKEWEVYKGDTIEEIAEQIGVDPVVLSKTVETYNAACDSGEDNEFFKPAEYLVPLRTPPYYVARLMPSYIATVGGLRVDENLRVLTPERKAIKGLYAIGGDAGGYYGYLYDVAVAAGAQQGFCVTGARFAIDDIIEHLA